MQLTLKEFNHYIETREFIPEIYIVRLRYKYVYEDKYTISNEILQYDPGYFVESDSRFPWYLNFWVWYTDWYMCVEPESVEVLAFTTLEEVFDET